MLVCKLDASGTDEENSILTMAGYVGLFPAWLDFEIAAKRVLDAHGVDYLHAKEFHDTKEAFKGWSRTRKEGFARELQGCIVGRLDLGVTFSGVKAEFLKAKTEHKVAHQESMFGYCFRAIVSRLLNAPVLKAGIEAGQDVSFVLESGDPNGPDAHRIFNEMKAIPAYDRALSSFGFADKKSAIGLQIADLLAVYSRRYVAKYSDKAGYADEPGIISILRDGVHLIDDVAVAFAPVVWRRLS